MIKVNTSRWYDVECDGRECERLASTDYGHCLGWATPTQAVNAALEAGWEPREEDGLEHMYCHWCRKGTKRLKRNPSTVYPVTIASE